MRRRLAIFCVIVAAALAVAGGASAGFSDGGDSATAAVIG